jgi:hypothetical protein
MDAASSAEVLSLPEGPAPDASVPGERPSQLQVVSLPAAGAISVSAVGWTPGGPLHVRRWVACGKRLVQVRSASSWWIGDWMRYGNAQYGEKYGAASLATGYDRQTLMNLAYVASRFPVERRRANVSWSHHAELAALPEAEQEAWLDRIERDRLSVRSLREEARRELSTRRRFQRPGTDAVVEIHGGEGQACPHCGSRMTAAPALRAPAPRTTAFTAGPTLWSHAASSARTPLRREFAPAISVL